MKRDSLAIALIALIALCMVCPASPASPKPDSPTPDESSPSSVSPSAEPSPPRLDATGTYLQANVVDVDGTPGFVHATADDMPLVVAIGEPKEAPRYGSRKQARAVAVEAIRMWEDAIRLRLAWFRVDFVDEDAKADVKDRVEAPDNGPLGRFRAYRASGRRRASPRRRSHGGFDEAGDVLRCSLWTRSACSSLTSSATSSGSVHCLDCDSAMNYAWHTRGRVLVTEVDVATFAALAATPNGYRADGRPLASLTNMGWKPPPSFDPPSGRSLETKLPEEVPSSGSPMRRAPWALPEPGDCGAALRTSGAAEDASAPGISFATGDTVSFGGVAALERHLPPEIWERRDLFFFEGMRLEIGPCYRSYAPPDFFREASQESAGRARLLPNGGIVGTFAGLPFAPESIDEDEPQAGQKWAWNASRRYQGAGQFGEIRVTYADGSGPPARLVGDHFVALLMGRADLSDGRLPWARRWRWVAGGTVRDPSTGNRCAFRHYRAENAESEPNASRRRALWNSASQGPSGWAGTRVSNARVRLRARAAFSTRRSGRALPLASSGRERSSCPHQRQDTAVSRRPLPRVRKPRRLLCDGSMGSASCAGARGTTGRRVRHPALSRSRDASSRSTMSRSKAAAR